ncbi:MAG: hypothetical protein PHE78_00535 [Candidatus Gastranaerophilales bacterium]|nr:hypothetical protein [Candidatus Gastranaerophilales bacterium]
MNMSVSNSLNYGHGSYYQNNYPTQTRSDESQVALSVAELAGASILIQQASKYLAHKLGQGDEFTSFDNVKKISDKMLSENGLKGKIDVGFLDDANKIDYIKKYGSQMTDSFETVAKGGNAFYMDGAKLAVAPKAKPSLMLHELGHAINASKGKFMRFLQKSRGWATAVPTALLMLNGAMGQSNDGKKNFVEKNAGLIGFAAFTPTIIEEGLASLRGVNAAKKFLGKGAKLGALKRNYALAWGTYILAGLGLALAAKQSVASS